MSHTVPSQHPAVVLRANYQHLRALLVIAIAVILALTIAVLALAISRNHTIIASPASQSAIGPNSTAQTRAKTRAQRTQQHDRPGQLSGRAAALIQP